MNSLLHALKRLFAQPDFVVVFVLLGVSAISLNFATDFLKLHFRKRALPLRIELDSAEGIPQAVGHWVQIGADPPLNPDVEHILGATRHIQRTYVNADVVGQTVADHLNGMMPDEQLRALGEIARADPTAILRAGVYYYTGLVDTVAHIPERCMIGDGFDMSSSEPQRAQKLGKYSDGTDRVVDLSYASFNDETGQGRQSRNVAYLFHVNGHYEGDSLGVRRSLQNLFEPYGYYAKVEVESIIPAYTGDSDAAQKLKEQSLSAIKDFLSAMLPEVERCLPDWRTVHEAPSH